MTVLVQSNRWYPEHPEGKPVSPKQLNNHLRILTDGQQDALTAFQTLMAKIQLGTIATGTIAASGNATVTVVWPNGYQDLNYVAFASVEGASLQVRNVLRSKTGLAVTVLNLDAGASHSGTVMAMGFHL